MVVFSVCRNDNILMLTNPFHESYLPFQTHILFMVVATAREVSGPVYEGIYTDRGYGEEYFYATWMAA